MARIAVIGAGMGAMATAARLAVAGHRVTVFERSRTYGGSVGRFERNGFVFDTGPGLLHLPAVYRDLFVKTGKEALEQCVGLEQVDPASRHVFADGTDVRLPNASRAGVLSALDSALGDGTGERWGAFLGRAREAWELSRRPLLEEPLRADWQVLGRDPYPALGRKRFLRGTQRASTVAEVGAWELTDPRLTALLDWYALSYGLDPRHTPASAAVLPYLEQTFGSWYVRGGIRELARAVYERCLARRVEFAFGTEVVRVIEKDGAAAGVELSDGRIETAERVVSGIDPAFLVSREVRRSGGADGGSGPSSSGGGRPVVPGRFSVLLALRGSRPESTAHRTVVHSPAGREEYGEVFAGRAAPAPTVTVLRPDDPSTRPDPGHEAVTVTATVAPQGPVDWTDSALREGYADTLVTAAAAAVPELAGRLIWREVRTPADTAVETGADGGSVPAPALAGAGGGLLRPANTTGMNGLYLAGGWAHPGGGLAHSGMSGSLVAGLIVEGEDFRGSR